jgi:hypothetical protein
MANPPDTCTEHDLPKPCHRCDRILDELRQMPTRREARYELIWSDRAR